MRTSLAAIIVCFVLILSSNVRADYAQGCDDPEYHQYMKERFEHFETRNRRLYTDTLRDYERSSATNSNPYQVISDLGRHLKYSAQFDPIDKVNAKIDQIFYHADELNTAQQIAGTVYDRFSSENHAVGIARAWIDYRQGNLDVAFKELLKSIEVSDSAVLSAFGPDVELIRRMYHDGHDAPVIAYIKKTEEFWTGRRPDKLRYVWLQMIQAKCQIQFDFIDTIKALELGLSVIDVNKEY